MTPLQHTIINQTHNPSHSCPTHETRFDSFARPLGAKYGSKIYSKSNDHRALIYCTSFRQGKRVR